MLSQIKKQSRFRNMFLKQRHILEKELSEKKTPACCMQHNNFKSLKLSKKSISYYANNNQDIPIDGSVYTVPVKIPNNPSLPIIQTNSCDTFQMAALPLFFLAQCFGIMPVSGILANNTRKVHFSYKSPQTIYTCMVLSACSVPCISITMFLGKIGIASNNIEGIIFYTFCEIALLLFLFLATRWPHIIRQWERTESIFLHPPYNKLRRSLAQRIRPIAFVLMFMAFGEHCLYQCSEVMTYVRERDICAHRPDNASLSEETRSFGDFIHRKHAHYLNVLPYYTFTGGLLLIINFFSTVVWNYMDIFILIISKGISYRFEQITLYINSLIGEATIAETVFMQIREHYVKLCKLLELIEDNVSSLILLTCTNNLFFICYQLLKVFNKLKYTINSVYYWYSLLFLIGRSAFVLLTAATIYDESKSSLSLLRRIPSKNWCIELERLMFEIRTQTVALSGKKFYFLTRTLVFGMAGTIVTYELVLLQFDEPNRKPTPYEFCASI